MAQEWRSLVDRLQKLDTPAVSDALDHLSLRGAVIGIRAMWPCPRIAGRAVTVKIVPAGLTKPEHHLATPAVESSEPGDVIVIDNAGRTDVSSWGDILSNAAQVKGIRGVVIDGACRDVDGSRDLGFPVYARAGVPVTARGRIMQESYNTLIQVGGVQVRPGDLVLADGSGVCFVPSERAEEVVETAERIVTREAAMVEAVRAGRSVVEVMAESAFQAIHETK
ncbi:MAG: putative ribonuclease inhibitor RraA/dimethylmenaquinone methyltransferase [Chloroflexi bacterium]|nr:putative ribonuclease inhibitor RraA/dimethylmenaquinone methyltransferase [Chloroflexota bacterium]